MLFNVYMADTEHMIANPRYHEVAEQLRGDPLYSRIWQSARSRASCVEERYELDELSFAFEPKYITYERNPERTEDYPNEDSIRYGTQLVLVCKFPSMLAGENEVVEMMSDDLGLRLVDDELATLAKIAIDSEDQHRLI